MIPAMPHILFLRPESRPQMPPKNARERHPSDRERRSVHKFFVCFYYLEIGKIFLDLGPVVYLRVWIKGPVGAHAQEISHLEIFAEPNTFRVREVIAIDPGPVYAKSVHGKKPQSARKRY